MYEASIIWSSDFASNLLAELVGAIVTLVLVTLVLERWLDRREKRIQRMRFGQSRNVGYRRLIGAGYIWLESLFPPQALEPFMRTAEGRVQALIGMYPPSILTQAEAVTLAAKQHREQVGGEWLRNVEEGGSGRVNERVRRAALDAQSLVRETMILFEVPLQEDPRVFEYVSLIRDFNYIFRPIRTTKSTG